MQHNKNPLEAADLGSSAVTTAKINDAAVTIAKLANPNGYLIFEHFISGNATAAAGKGFWVVPVACTITHISAYVHGTAPAGSTAIFDVNKNGTTVFTTQNNRPTVADGANVSTTTAPDVTAVAAGDRLSYDIDQIGSGTAGSNYSITILAKLNLVA